MISKPKGLAALSACDLVKMTRTRQVSCVEVVEACLARADDINPTINAFCTITADRALDAARTADASVTTSAKMGPLYGIPVALKDLTPTAGVRTTFGSKLYAHNVPSQDALLVQRIVAAGGIILGKTNTPEFGHKGITDNLVFGPTRNPWNTELTAGGSSGGSAAAVVANIVPIAEGSDGAGSIRIPASLCGAFGFKPTYGRIPDVAGAFSSHSPFFHNGPITRTVSDAALFYEAVAGADISDPFSIPYDESAVATLNDGIKGLKIAYSEDLGYFEVCPQVRDAMRRAVDVFESSRVSGRTGKTALRPARRGLLHDLVAWPDGEPLRRPCARGTGFARTQSCRTCRRRAASQRARLLSSEYGSRASLERSSRGPPEL